MNQLEVAGHTVTYDWTVHKATDEFLILQQEAIEDLLGVAKADLLVLVSPFRFSSAGETTAALILGKPVVIVGTTLEELGNVFLFAFHPNVFVVDTVEDVLQIIRAVEITQRLKEAT